MATLSPAIDAASAFVRRPISVFLSVFNYAGMSL